MQENPEPSDLDLSKFGKRLSTHKPLTFGLMFVLGAALASYAWFSPPVYSASATIVSMQAIRPTEMVSPRAVGLATPDPLLVLRGIIISRSNLTLVSGKTGTKLKELQDKLVVETESERGQVILTWLDSKPERAVEVLDATLSSLRETLKTINFSSAELSANNLAKTIGAREKQLKEEEDRFLKLQKSTKAALSPTDMNQIGTLASLREEKRLALDSLDAKMNQMEKRWSGLEKTDLNISGLNSGTKSLQAILTEKELSLRLAKVSQGDQSPTVVRLTKEVEQVREKLKLALRNYIQSMRKGLDEQTSTLLVERAALQSQLQRLDSLVAVAPDEALELSRSYRRVMQLTTTLSELKVQYEKARINSTVEQVNWNILDAPVSEIVSKKSRSVKLGLLGACFGFALSVVILLLTGNRSKKNK
jgi:uncharacterized protein involved in exopolysaccharide biosynthesis